MALTEYQCSILRLLAGERKRHGERYVAGGVALNELPSAPRLSRDLDLFHDTDEAIAASWEADSKALIADGNALTVIREAPSFIEAVAARGSERTAIQWAWDSALRFFPLSNTRRSAWYFIRSTWQPTRYWRRQVGLKVR
jgi:hypothetical protein